MKKTINATINADRALSKIQRYFTASLDQILTELFQNSRRAKATQLDITLNENTLTLQDNGEGVEDPQILLNLFGSGWDEDIQEREDPAGAGLYSLSSRGCTISSHDWLVTITPDGFVGKEPVKVYETEFQPGTRISFQVTENELYNQYVGLRNISEVQRQVNKRSLYYPVAVTYNGEPVEQKSYISDTYYCEEWRGLKIGVYPSQSLSSKESSIFSLNFYGQVVFSIQCNHVPGTEVRVDVVNCPELKLVLPTRDRIVQNEFYEELKQQIILVAYRSYVGQEHSLAYSHYTRAQELGVGLSEARPQWRQWTPDEMADYEGYSHAETEYCLPTKGAYWLTDSSVVEDQLIKLTKHELNLIYIDPRFAGYSWANAISQLYTNIKVTHNNEEYLGEAVKSIKADGYFVDKIEILFYQGKDLIKAVEVGALLFTSSESVTLGMSEEKEEEQKYQLGTECSSYFDSADFELFISKSNPVSADELADLLVKALFLQSGEGDSEQEQADFEEEATVYAQKLLVSDKAALETKIRNAVAGCYFQVPPGYSVTVTLKVKPNKKRTWMTDRTVDIQVQKVETEAS